MGTSERHLYVSMIVSVDGYIEGPEGSLEWFPDEDPQFARYCEEMMDSVGLAVYGRRAYELMVRYWPAAEVSPRSPQELRWARTMNALPKLVLSRTLEHAGWSHTEVVRDVGAIAARKHEPGKPIVAWAGAGLCASLLDAQLVDEIRLLVAPVVLGGGTPAFDPTRGRRRLRHVRTQSLEGGTAVLCYEPVR